MRPKLSVLLVPRALSLHGRRTMSLCGLQHRQTLPEISPQPATPRAAELYAFVTPYGSIGAAHELLHPWPTTKEQARAPLPLRETAHSQKRRHRPCKRGCFSGTLQGVFAVAGCQASLLHSSTRGQPTVASPITGGHRSHTLTGQVIQVHVHSALAVRSAAHGCCRGGGGGQAKIVLFRFSPTLGPPPTQWLLAASLAATISGCRLVSGRASFRNGCLSSSEAE